MERIQDAPNNKDPAGNLHRRRHDGRAHKPDKRVQDLQQCEGLRDLQQRGISVGEDGGDVDGQRRWTSVLGEDELVQEETDRAEGERTPEEEVRGVVEQEVLPR